ncbi:MAG: hypothetical protein KIS92_17465, partial [Planctomycetota bacterium]|nr:hypothetical protein [Planctomycetota bacterium]
SEPVRAAWTFDRPEVAAEFRLTRGAWTWTSPEGSREAGMAVPEQALAELPVPLQARPMKITMRYVPLKHAMHAEFGCYYLNQDHQIPSSSWGKRGSVGIRPWFTITYYCYEEWVLCFQDGIPNYLSKYPQAYPTERIGVSLRNGLMFSLTLEPLSQDEAARLFEHPDQYIEANGFKPIR